MRISRWIPKVTDTHSEYVVPIAFPRQQWLRERSLILSCTYIDYLVLISLSQMSHCQYETDCTCRAVGSSYYPMYLA